MDANIDEDVNEAWQDLLDDKSDTAWILAGYEGKAIKLKSKGPGGRAECLAAIPDDTQLFFGGCKVVYCSHCHLDPKHYLLQLSSQKTVLMYIFIIYLSFCYHVGL
jgi:hypothetical protein